MKWSPSLAAYTALGAAVFYSALGCPQNPAEGGSSGGVLRPIDINIPRPSRPVRPLQPPGTDTRHHCHSKRQIPAGSGVVGGVLRPIDINIPRPARPVRPSTSSRISSHRNPQKRQYGVRYGKLGLEGDFEEIYEQTHEGQAAYVYINGPLKPKPHTCGNCPPCHGRGAKGDDYQCIVRPPRYHSAP